MEGELHCESRPAAATRTLAEPELVADQHSAGGTLRVKTHVLDANDFVPSCSLTVYQIVTSSAGRCNS